MNIQDFIEDFDRTFPIATRSSPHTLYNFRFLRRWFDPCPTVPGMSSIKKLKLLQKAYSFLPPDECYLEIGTFVGKSLIAAMLKNEPRKTYACDNFSQFNDVSSEKILLENVRKYGLQDIVTFYNEDFRRILNPQHIKEPIGLYLYDGAHDFDSQYQAIKQAEHLLADHALVIVDDWRFADDSHSYAKAGTLKAIEESANRFELLYDLPSRFNGDHATWWNGVAVFAFHRQAKNNTGTL
ncbi:MAG: class I SAM-dependent methyltransferase [Bacteroidota bacterium]